MKQVWPVRERLLYSEGSGERSELRESWGAGDGAFGLAGSAVSRPPFSLFWIDVLHHSFKFFTGLHVSFSKTMLRSLMLGNRMDVLGGKTNPFDLHRINRAAWRKVLLIVPETTLQLVYHRDSLKKCKLAVFAPTNHSISVPNSTVSHSSPPPKKNRKVITNWHNTVYKSF